MPGMDGLQAVQHIKNDPRTATIPIMMYTSQEGELYLGQARALGAIGVLPKQIKPTDVSKVLYQLHLVPDRRTPEQSSFKPMNLRLEAGAPEATAGVLSKPLTDTALREHFAELRRALVAGVDTQTDRITGEVRALLLESLPQPQPSEDAPLSLGPASRRRASPPWAWIVACSALAIALISSLLWWRSVRLLEGLTEEVAQLRLPRAAPLASLTGATAASATAAAGPVVEAKPILALVPYGADALGGGRLDVIGKLLSRLVAQRASGPVDLRTFAGRFCLMGNGTDGYSLAPEEMLFSRCDVVGNPYDDALSPTQRMPLALANLIGEVRSSTNGALSVRAAVGDPAQSGGPLPAGVPDAHRRRMEPRADRQQSHRDPLALNSIVLSAAAGEEFQPARWLRNRHLQSMLASTAWRHARVLARAARMPPRRARAAAGLRGGRAPAGLHLHAPAATAAHRSCCCTAGREARSRSTCSRSRSGSTTRGFEVVRLNLRDHGETHQLNRDLFHSCRLPEVVGAVGAPAAHHLPGARRSWSAFRSGATSCCGWQPRRARRSCRWRR